MSDILDEAILLYVTCATQRNASSVAKLCVERKLAACANMFEINSISMWEGKVCDAKEYAMIIKTIKGNIDQVTRVIKELSGYTCPCILHIAVSGWDEGFLSWILNSCKKAEL